MELEPDDLRAFVGRDWTMLEGLTRRSRAELSIEERVRIGIELYEAARATRPDWPDDETRRADLEMHLRLRRLLDRASDVGAR